MTAPDLFDHAAERAALETGRPLSQERTELTNPVPPELPPDGLFGAVE